MSAGIRYVVWPIVILAAIAVGYYLNTAPTSVAAAPAASEPGRYVFLAGGADPYWELCVAGAKEAASRSGAEVEVRMPTGEGEEGLREQLGWLRDVASAGGVDGVAIGPIDPDRQTTPINTLAEKATVVTVDSDAPGSRRMFYVGSSNYEAGEIAAQLVREALPDGGQVAVLIASLAKTNAAERSQGLEEALAAPAKDDSARVAASPRGEEDAAGGEAGEAGEQPEYEIVATYMDRGDYELCRENVRKAVEQNPGLDAIVCTFGYHGPIALETLAGIDGGDAVQVIAFDEDPRVLDAIRSGRAHATIAQDPFMFGYEAIRMLEEVRSGRYLALPVSGRVDVGVHCIPVRADNLDDFKKRLEDRLGQARSDST
ncbi:substrate-binding domain-containing protein [Botrimarina sp.]|uniref:substrate-binding domain-containing protein n=1 Tax=Botrimarina sp. TaxID=2795802 RepID=UPI0032EEC686